MASSEAVERARPSAPTAPANRHDITRRVFTSMAGRRLLPKEGWILNRAIHDTVAPTVKVHLVAGRATPAIAHRLLEDTIRRHIVSLTMDRDFTNIQERPLSLPPSLVRLELNGFRGELDPAPAGLRDLLLRAMDGETPHPLLKSMFDNDAVQIFNRETAEIIGAMLPTLRTLEVCGRWDWFINLSSCMQVLCKLPRAHLEYLHVLSCSVHWEDLLLLLTPAVTKVALECCRLYPDAVLSRSVVPELPDGLLSLDLIRCEFSGTALTISRLPDSLRHLVVQTEEDSDGSVHFEQPLPSLLESFKLVTFDNTVDACEGMLPAGLRVLELVGRHHQWLDEPEVPPSLRVLKLRAHRHPLPQLPDTLETLELNECTHHVSDIPNSVRSLSLYWRPPQPMPPLPARWPAHLERLMYWAKSDCAPMPAIKRLPPTLRELALNGCEVHAGLPRTLQKVRLGRNFTQDLTFTGRVTVNSNDNWYF
eukprot:TRINITY_DN6583_c0_g3_i2.p1 TRINITY_DN6583_c0_g3~~TRINITY_DN6583_c0_g3_i2.p1  ORF type:complete len:488 (+),score=47.68 TRINITY_DN6583_c0_g3_i2:32-1465(+)